MERLSRVIAHLRIEAKPNQHRNDASTKASLAPLVGFGTWNAKRGEVKKLVELAIDTGYRHIDCAAAYGNEKEVGEALASKIGSVVKREELFVVSKLWNTCHEYKDVLPACQQSLRDLGLQYLDLYLIHWPVSFKAGEAKFPTTPDGRVAYGYTDLHETWRAMEELVRKKLVKAIGLSNFNSKQIDRIISKATIRPTCLQVESHAYLNQDKLINFCNQRGIQVVAYSPLGSPDRPWAQKGDPSLLDDPKIVAIAKKYHKTPAQILLRFTVQRGVAVIPKSATHHRIIENFQVLQFRLDEADMQTIKSLNRNHRLCVPTFKNNKGEIRLEIEPDHPENPLNEEF